MVTLMEINNMLDRSLVLLSKAETAQQQQQHEIKVWGWRFICVKNHSR